MGFGIRNARGVAMFPYFKVYINGEYASYDSYGADYNSMKRTTKELKIAPLTEKQVDLLSKLIMKNFRKGIMSGSKMYRKSKKDVEVTWRFSDRH